MGVQTVTTNIYECDYCKTTSQDPTGWFQVWVVNIMDPKYFHSATCAIALLTAANVAPEVNIIVEDVPEEDRNPAPPSDPTEPVPVPDPTPGPAPVDPEPAPVPEDVVEPTPEPTPEPPAPEPAPEPEPQPQPEPEPTEPEPVIEEAEVEPPLDPDEPQPAE